MYFDVLHKFKDVYPEGDERHENADKHIWAIELMLKKLPTQERFKVKNVCPICKGKGMVQIGKNIRGLKQCENCFGTGYITKVRGLK